MNRSEGCVHTMPCMATDQWLSSAPTANRILCASGSYRYVISEMTVICLYSIHSLKIYMYSVCFWLANARLISSNNIRSTTVIAIEK